VPIPRSNFPSDERAHHLPSAADLIRPKIAFVDRARTRPNHVDKLPDFERERLEQFLSEIGSDLEHVRAGGSAGLYERCRCWVHYFMRVQACTSTEIYFVSNLCPQQSRVLNEFKVKRVLVSYYNLRNKRTRISVTYR